MLEGREGPEGHVELLTENRMHVLFVNGGGPRRAFGPYRTVQVTADSVWVYDGPAPLRIACKNGGLWELPDGSDRPAVYRHVLVLCPPSGVTAAQLEERLSPRTRE
jgi:hypothetical protein